jgi:hypothetical protein
MMKFVAAVSLLLCLGHGVTAASQLVTGGAGESCSLACLDRGLNCNPHIPTNNSKDVFAIAGAACKSYGAPEWLAGWEPAMGATNGTCSGWSKPSGGVACQNSLPDVRRICACDAPADDVKPFGTAYSQGVMDATERTMFAHALPAGHTGVMTHFWLTPCSKHTTVRYYIDGEANASIAFKPALAGGVGFDDNTAPWGTKWFSKAAKRGGWSWNFRVPFQNSVRVTVQNDRVEVLYLIFRGAQDLNTNIGGVDIPPGARLQQFTVNRSIAALELVDLATVPAGKSGMVFMHTLSGESATENFMEGCYHFYSPPAEPWPGLLLSSGTEDYFDSAFYFDAGEYYLPVAGLTHYATARDRAGRAANVSMSAYRFHEQDPLRFQDGMKLQWRVGDLFDASLNKCFVAPGEPGIAMLHPKVTKVVAYVWVYVW